MRRSPLILLVLVQASRLAAGSVNATVASPTIGAEAYTGRSTVSGTGSSGDIILTVTPDGPAGAGGVTSPSPASGSIVATSGSPGLASPALIWGCEPSTLVSGTTSFLIGGTITGGASYPTTTQGSTTFTGTVNSGTLSTGTGSLIVPGPLETVGGTYLWEVNNSVPNLSPQTDDALLNITGSGSLSPFDLTVGTLTPSNLTVTNPVGTGGYTWTVVSAVSVPTYNAGDFTLDLSGFTNLGSGSWSVVSSDGNSNLSWTIIGAPEANASTTSTSSTFQDPAGDTDGDGVSNLLENAFGSDPLLPGGTRRPRPLLDLVDSETHAGLTYTRSKTVLGVTFNVEFSSTPADSGFAPAPFTETSVTDNGDGTETVTVRETAPSTGTRFARLRVIQN